MAFVTPELSANPMSLTVFGFSSAWFLSITSESFRRSELVQSGNKMRSMAKEPPKVRGVRLPAEALAITQSYQQEYANKELELLWAALLKAYGTQELALQAARENPQVLNPSYSFCNTIIESKRVLLTMMTEQEAIEVMRLNPAVLQCGPTLDPLGKGEIMAFARLRSVGNALVPPQLRSAAVSVFLAAVFLVVLTSGVDEFEALSAVLRPVLGTVLAGSFLFTAYAAAKSS